MESAQSTRITTITSSQRRGATADDTLADAHGAGRGVPLGPRGGGGISAAKDSYTEGCRPCLISFGDGWASCQDIGHPPKHGKAVAEARHIEGGASRVAPGQALRAV